MLASMKYLWTLIESITTNRTADPAISYYGFDVLVQARHRLGSELMVAHRLLHHGAQADNILGVNYRDFTFSLLLDSYILSKCVSNDEMDFRAEPRRRHCTSE